MDALTQSFKNKIAIITGSGRGIGASTAEVLAESGAKVVLTSRSISQLQEVSERIEKHFGKNHCLIFAGDIGDEDFVSHLFQEVEKQWGAIDILINNAATLEMGDFPDFKTESWDETMRVNLRGPFLCSRFAFQAMIRSKRGGCIVNLSSLGGIKGTEKFPGLSAYTVSKHGIVGLTESLAVEGKKHNIRVNCVAPGAVETTMLKKAAPFLKTKTKPEDIAKIILFLCDEQQSKALTGSVLEIHSNE